MAMSPRDALATISAVLPEMKLSFKDHLTLQECIKTLLALVEQDEKSRPIEEAPAERK